MNGVSSFGSNIENILGDILVKRSTIKELLNEIKNISVVNIEKSNSLVEKMLSVTQVINERTNEIEKEYSNFISHKNSFSDLTYWEEKVYPEITNTFEIELQEYLKQLLTLESICEKYFIQVIEDELASDDQRHLITKNPYKNDNLQNQDIKDNYTYPNSVGYNWYSIKANDDYMTNSKSLLNISKYDKDKYIETNQINKSSILHETISFHPKYGLIHYLSLGRERTLSSIRDDETNSPVSTIEFKTFDGFNGEMSELKSHLDRNIFSNSSTSNKNDIKYQLLLRHNMDSNNGTSYFILKMRDYEPLENGVPSYYFINRNNLDTANITRSYSDATTNTKSFINPSIKDNNNDINLPDNESIIKSINDTDEDYTPSKRLSEIFTDSFYLNTSYLSIKGKEYNILRKATIKDTKDFIYNYNTEKPFVTFATVSKCNKPQNTNNRDLFSNLKLRIWGYPLINNNNSTYISYNGKYESFRTLNYLDNYSKYQISHKEFNKYHKVTPLELNVYGLTDNSIVYNKTILERRIINNNNQNFDKFTSYTLEESYNLFNENNNKENSDYYYENYNKGITLYTARNDNTLLPETTRNLQANTIKSYTNLPDYNLQDVSTQEHSVYIYGNDDNNYDNKFNFKTLKDGYWPTNTMITYYCASGKHVWALGRNFNEIYYSEDSGLTWNKSAYDKDNSTKKYDNLSAVTCNINYSSCYMLNTGLGIMCEHIWNSNTGCYLYTEDFGKTFRTMWAGNDSISIEFVYINRNGYGLAACHTSGHQKVHYTRDYGKTWTYTTTTTDINCVYVEDNNDIGYAMGTNSYSGMQKVINLKEGTPTWSNFIPFKDGNFVRTLAMFDFDNYDGILPIIVNEKNPSLFNTKNQSCINLKTDGLNNGLTTDTCNGFWLDKYGNIFHTQDKDIYINSNSWKDKKGTIKLSFGNEIDAVDLGNYLYRPICVLFDEQIILQQSATNRNKIYRIPYGIRNYSVKRNNKFYNCYKQLNISNSKVSSLSNEEIETIKENVKKELENYYKEKEKLYIGTISILPYNDKDHEKWLKCDGRMISKIEYSELYNKLGDLYNIGDEEEGFFRLPNMNEKTILGANKDLIGKTIKDALPNIEFSAEFINNETVFENDKRYGIMGLNSTIDEEAIGVMGGLDGVGVNKTKLKIPHNSKSKETVGNMFEVSFYVKAK